MDARKRVTQKSIQYKCGRSPLIGLTFHTRIERVWVNGDDGDASGAEALQFSK